MKWKCDKCGFGPVEVRSLPVYCVCQTADKPYVDEGAGTELKGLLRSWGINPNDCACESRAIEMNVKGPQWCRDNIATISGWLKEAAHKRRLPYFDALGRRLILQAIRNAEAKTRPDRT